MVNAKVLTLVPVKLDGKEMTAIHASPCLAACTEVAMVLHCLVNATILLNGQEDFVIPLFVRAVPMVIALLLAFVNVTLAGEAKTAQTAFH